MILASQKAVKFDTGTPDLRVIFVPFKDGKPSGTPQDIVTGFLNANEEARGRPVGPAVDAAGGLLIADDLDDTVWRVTSARGTSPAPSEKLSLGRWPSQGTLL
jgi:glucose/arabinose dehydrogenase